MVNNNRCCVKTSGNKEVILKQRLNFFGTECMMGNHSEHFWSCGEDGSQIAGCQKHMAKHMS